MIRAEEPEVRARGRERRGAESAVPDDHRRDSLADLEVHLGHQEHREVVVTVHVDEARCEREPRAVDRRSRALGAEITDRRDASTGDADVAHARRTAGAVVDGCAPDDEVHCPSVTPLDRLAVVGMNNGEADRTIGERAGNLPGHELHDQTASGCRG